MLDGSTTLATATQARRTTTVTLDLQTPPTVRQAVNGVAVEIVGGTVPVPTECSSHGVRPLHRADGGQRHPRGLEGPRPHLRRQRQRHAPRRQPGRTASTARPATTSCSATTTMTCSSAATTTTPSPAAPATTSSYGGAGNDTLHRRSGQEHLQSDARSSSEALPARARRSALIAGIAVFGAAATLGVTSKQVDSFASDQAATTSTLGTDRHDHRPLSCDNTPPTVGERRMYYDSNVNGRIDQIRLDLQRDRSPQRPRRVHGHITNGPTGLVSTAPHQRSSVATQRRDALVQ